MTKRNTFTITTELKAEDIAECSRRDYEVENCITVNSLAEYPLYLKIKCPDRGLSIRENGLYICLYSKFPSLRETIFD